MYVMGLSHFYYSFFFENDRLIEIVFQNSWETTKTTYENRPSHNKSPKPFLWTAYLETSELKASKRT